jgi:hypothetical protein
MEARDPVYELRADPHCVRGTSHTAFSQSSCRSPRTRKPSALKTNKVIPRPGLHRSTRSKLPKNYRD